MELIKRCSFHKTAHIHPFSVGFRVVAQTPTEPQSLHHGDSEAKFGCFKICSSI